MATRINYTISPVDNGQILNIPQDNGQVWRFLLPKEISVHNLILAIQSIPTERNEGNVLMMFCKQRAVETGFTSAPNHMELHHIQGFIDWLCDTHKRFSKYAGPIDAIRAVD